MQNEPAAAPRATPPAGIVPHSVRAVTEAASRASASSPGGRRPVRFVLRNVMSAPRGDKYMVGAYPPDWATSWTRSDQAGRSEDGAPPAAGAVSATPSEGR